MAITSNPFFLHTKNPYQNVKSMTVIFKLQKVARKRTPRQEVAQTRRHHEAEFELAIAKIALWRQPRIIFGYGGSISTWVCNKIECIWGALEIFSAVALRNASTSLSSESKASRFSSAGAQVQLGHIIATSSAT